MLNAWIEMGMVRYPDQSLTAPKIVLIIMTKTMTDILLKTRLPKARLQEVAGRQDREGEDIEKEFRICLKSLMQVALRQA